MDGFFDISTLLYQQPFAQRQLVAQVIQRVVQQIPADIAAIKAACASAAPAAAAPLLHRLRGSVGSLGAPRFVDASLRLEALLQASDGAGVPAALESVERELNCTRTAALAWLEAQPAYAAAAPAAPDADFARFEQLLEQRNMDACALLAHLRFQFEKQYGGAFAAQMDEHMAQLHFAAALGLLKNRSAHITSAVLRTDSGDERA